MGKAWLGLALALTGCPATTVPERTPIIAATALMPAWSDLFKRKEGWTGGDGIFAIPLSGHEGPGRAAEGKTLFVFSDTFIGQVDSAGKRVDATLVNNSMAILEGADPDPAKIRFLWGRDAEGRARAAFVPETPKTREALAAGRKVWYWLQDGFVHAGNFYNLPLIVEHRAEGDPGWQFQEIGVALVKAPLGADGEPDLDQATQVDAPLFHQGAGGRALHFGCGILVNTAEAGAPDPDGHVYVYGRNSLYVARVPAEAFEDFTRWRFWDGTDWNVDIAKSASLGDAGPELSVIPVAEGALKGKYLLTTSGLEAGIHIRLGDSPRGPFGQSIHVFTAEEWDPVAPIYTYNAKAHPSLSDDGTWLVSYNVNTSDWDLNLSQADIYRPRFFAMRFDPGSISSTVLNRPSLRGRSQMGMTMAGGMPRVRASEDRTEKAPVAAGLGIFRADVRAFIAWRGTLPPNRSCSGRFSDPGYHPCR